MKKFLLILFFALSINLSAQKIDADRLLDNVKAKFEKVNDYQVNVSIKLDISFAKVPDTKAKIYFKKPDKFKFDSQGFAMIPKQSVNFSPAQLLRGDYTAVFSRTETVNNRDLAVIKIIPNSDSVDFVLSTFWIDPENELIRKIEMNGRRGGTTIINFEYDNIAYALPSKLTFSFDVGGNTETPQQMQQQMQQNQNEPNQQGRGHRRNMGPLSGNVIVTYSNYEINKGIPDSFFEEKKK